MSNFQEEFLVSELGHDELVRGMFLFNRELKKRQKENQKMATGDPGYEMQYAEQTTGNRPYAPVNPTRAPGVLVFPITITKLLSGYNVKVGCQELAFETTERLVSELKRYLDNPHQVQKEYQERA